jgi:hypothetical protein
MIHLFGGGGVGVGACLFVIVFGFSVFEKVFSLFAGQVIEFDRSGDGLISV